MKKITTPINLIRPIKVIQKNTKGEVVKNWDNISIASRNYRVSKKTLLNCCDGKIGYVKGYKWEYNV